MFGIEKVEEIVETNTNIILDAVKEKVDATEFKEIADTLLNKIEGAFKEGGMIDGVAENITGRIRVRFNIEDSNPDN